MKTWLKDFTEFLNHGTSDERKEWFNVGDYKKVANEVGGETTVSPEKVSPEMKKLLAWYNELSEVTIQDIIKFTEHEMNFEVCGLNYSPIKGPQGNIEYLMYIKNVDVINNNFNIDDIQSVVRESHENLWRFARVIVYEYFNYL